MDLLGSFLEKIYKRKFVANPCVAHVELTDKFYFLNDTL